MYSREKMKYIKYFPYKYLYKNRSLFSEQLLSYVSLGFFDGVHLGHQALLKRCREEAKRDKALSTVILLDPHPEKIVNKNNSFPLLTTLSERVKLIENMGIDQVIALDFTDEFKETNAEDFIRILINKFHMAAVFVGYDYHFGCQKKGDINLIKLLSEKYKFKYYILNPIKINDKTIISSTIIRQLLTSGDLENANKLLGYFYQIRGKVVYGAGRGSRFLSFPTANLKIPPEKLLPKNGVYIALVEVEEQKYQGLVNIGVKPTFQPKTSLKLEDASVEVHILNFAKNIYNRIITISLIKKIREEKRFSNTEELSQQINNDKLRALEFFSLSGEIEKIKFIQS